jgi:uncharacterized protein (TIGR03067 family)
LVVDPRPTPRHLDLIPGDDKDQPEEHLMGIYELQGDTLRIALPPDDKAPWPGPRPTSFTNENTWVLVRVK